MLINSTKMKKYIEISEEDLARLVCGKCVKGSLHRDKWTGRISFLGYKCHPRNRLRDLLVEKLPWGWVKESLERIKVYGSFPKEEGSVSVVGMLDEHVRDAERAIIDRDIVEFC